MTAKIIFGIDFKSKRREAEYDAMIGQANQAALEIANVALLPSNHDTSPCEMNTDGDCA